MRRIVLAAAFWIFTLGSTAICAETGKLGLGVMVGQPTGVNVKYWLTDKTAIDGGLGLRYGYHDRHFCDDDYYRRHGYYPNDCSDRESRLQIHADYLWHFDLPANLPGRLPFNVGVGARIVTPYTEFGMRIPLGVSYLFDNIPLDVFCELAPVIQLAPFSGLDLDGGVGARFYFGGPPAAGGHSSRHRR
jgi:hypothetical protein